MVSNKPYKSASVFMPASGNVQYNFQVCATGTATVLASLDSVNIKNGGVYTICYHGAITGTNPKLAIDVINNAQY